MKRRKLPSRIVALDVETTGLSPTHGHRVIEIGAVAIEDGRTVDEFHSLINPGRRISSAAQKVHGITDEILVGHPDPELVFPLFHQFIRGSALIAHFAVFDMSFLRQEFQKQRLALNQRFICTLELSRCRFPELPDHKLHTVYQHVFGKAAAYRRHRALDDARMVAEVWVAMTSFSQTRELQNVRHQEPNSVLG